MQDSFGFAGTPAFCKRTGFAGAVARHGVIVGNLVTGTTDDRGSGIAIFSKGSIDGNYPVFPVEKNVRFGLCLKKRTEFGKGHMDSLLAVHFLILPWSVRTAKSCQLSNVCRKNVFVRGKKQKSGTRGRKRMKTGISGRENAGRLLYWGRSGLRPMKNSIAFSTTGEWMRWRP